MSKELIDDVARILFGNSDEEGRAQAKSAILAVLEHFSEPGNITPAHVVAFQRGWNTNTDPRYPALAAGLSAFMDAARDEVSRGG